MFTQKKNRIIFLMSLILVFLIGCLDVASNSLPKSATKNTSQGNKTLSLGIPIECKLGEDCFIMHYVDLDPNQGIIDFGCGRQTYDGHKGTDFGIANLQIMARGIPVIAAASGKVLRTRDGIPDKLITNSTEKQAVANQECGNGIVIDHGNGWETQYCHLRQGSIAVEPNARVEKGSVLGMVGSSGLASFPHVHLSVRKDGAIVDPFVGKDTKKGCNQNLNPLWSKSLDYNPTGLIDAGFASQPPTQEELWSGRYREERLEADLSTLIFWVRAFGVLQGDIEKWQLIAPDGTVAVNREKTLDKPFRSWLSYSGKRDLTSGIWRGKYQLWRNGSLVFEVSKKVMLDNR